MNKGVIIGCYFSEAPNEWTILTASVGVKSIVDLSRTALSIEDIPIVLFSPKDARVPGEISLADFKHPEQAIYCFGSDKATLSDWTHPGQRVYIPTIRTATLYANHAAAIVFYDKMLKEA